MIDNRKNAMSGVMSIGPSVGTMRRNGASIHSVRTKDQRIQRENGEIWNQDETTRTMSAIRIRLNAHDASMTPSRVGLSSPHIRFARNPPRNWSAVTSRMPPTTTNTSVHQGALVGKP